MGWFEFLTPEWIKRDLREAKAEIFHLRGKVRAMANELQNLQTATAAALGPKIDAIAPAAAPGP